MMAVDTTSTLALYNSMIAEHKKILDAEFDANRLTDDLYAKGLLSLMQSTMQLATATTQQQPMIDAQVAKTNADTSFVGTQETELSSSVDYNNKIKALDSYSDMIGTMGAGGITISTDMWTAYFEMVATLNGSVSAVSDKTISIVT
jgi:hypothetical protein